MKIFLLVLGGALLPWLVHGADRSSLSFDETLQLAERNAPSLAAATARDAAARHAALAAGQLPDPKLVMGLDNLPVSGADAWSLGRDFMTMQRVGVSQDLPNGGKRRARVAEAEAAIADAEFSARITRLQVRREAALAWLNGYYSVARLGLQADLVRENALLEKTIAARYASGAAAATELLSAQREALVLADQQDELVAAQARADAELARVLGRPAQISSAAELPHFEIDIEHLRAHLEQHPQLRIYEARTAGAHAALREAEAGKRPDWNVEVSYQHRGPRYGEMVSAQLSVDLPLFSAHRQDPLIAARADEVTALDDELSALLRSHAAELEQDVADYQRLQRQAHRARSQGLPLAQQTLDLAYQAYGAGNGSLADLLEARCALASARFDALNLDAARLGAAAQLYFRYEGGEHD